MNSTSDVDKVDAASHVEGALVDGDGSNLERERAVEGNETAKDK